MNGAVLYGRTGAQPARIAPARRSARAGTARSIDPRAPATAARAQSLAEIHDQLDTDGVRVCPVAADQGAAAVRIRIPGRVVARCRDVRFLHRDVRVRHVEPDSIRQRELRTEGEPAP